MSDSPIQTELTKAMAAAWGELDNVQKDAKNSHFNKRYATLGAVIDAVRPVLSKHGLWAVQLVDPIDHGIAVITRLFHASGESMDLGTVVMPVQKNDAQGYGSALTYARRYGMLAAFCLAPDDDDDGNAAAAARPPFNPSGAKSGVERAKQAVKGKGVTTGADVSDKFGETAAATMTTFLADQGVSMDDVRAFLKETFGDAKTADGDPAGWPKAWRDPIKGYVRDALAVRAKEPVVVPDADAVDLPMD